MPFVTTQGLYGRQAELTAIHTLLTDAQNGTSGALVLRGEPGIGKSALLSHALENAAATMRVLRAVGIEYEAELPYAGLNLLLRPALSRLKNLPEPQRRALEAAFGLSEAPAAPDPMFVGLAVLSLLAEHAENGALLCVVDDAQWLDKASADALVFAARRLHSEGTALLFAARDGEGAFPAPGLPELRPAALRPEDAAGMLDAQSRDLAPALRYRILAEASGNPLALRELPVALATEPLSSTTVPLTARLQSAFHGQVSRLPGATQRLLLTAAAEETGDLSLVLRASGSDITDLSPAEETSLVHTSNKKLTFRHPLIRAAVYQSAPLADRIAAHQALADKVEAPDRRAWHLAAAATGPDETAATALEETATRAHERGGPAAAAAALDRSVQLTTDQNALARRLTAAADRCLEVGWLDRAREFALRATAEKTDVRESALLAGILALTDFRQGAFPAAHRRFLDGAAGATPEDAAKLLLYSVHTAWYLGEAAVADSVDRMTALLPGLPPGSPVAPVIRYMSGAFGTGKPPQLAEAIKEFADNPETDTGETAMACGSALSVGQDADAYSFATQLVQESRTRGCLSRLPTLLFFKAEAEVFQGRHRDAHASAVEALQISRDTGQQQWISQFSAVLAYLSGVEGDADACRTHADEAFQKSAGAAMAPGTPWAHWALGVLDLGQGRAESALTRLEPLTREPLNHHVCAVRSTPDLVEAAVRVGEPARAASHFARFEAWSARVEQPWAAALVLRCQALLETTDPEEAFTGALTLHAQNQRPVDQARTALLYGEWLRRARRKADARGHLSAALEIFERLNLTPWADRARTELGATGGVSATVNKNTGALAELTPQELQIVRLAATGLSNKDIAAQLFLSPRTVGHHLYKAYPKLGVLSRGELASITETDPAWNQ